MARVAVVSPSYSGDPDEDDRRYCAVKDALDDEPGVYADLDLKGDPGTFLVNVRQVPDWLIVDPAALAARVHEASGGVSVSVRLTSREWPFPILESE